MTLKEKLSEIFSCLEQGKPLNALQFSNEDLENLYGLAYHCYQAKDLEKAKDLFHQLVLSKPLEKKYWMGFAASYQCKGDFLEALKGWAMAALLDHEDPNPHFYASECYLSLNQLKEAKKALLCAKRSLRKEDENLKDKITCLENILEMRQNQGDAL